MRALKWQAAAKLAGPVTLEVLGEATLRLELPAGAVSRGGSGAYAHLDIHQVDGLIKDLQAARREMA